MIPSEHSPAARHSELLQWHHQIKNLRKNAPADAIAGIDSQSRQVCVVMPQDSASVKSVVNYDWNLLSKALGEMVIEFGEIASKLGLKEPTPFPLKTEELAACPLSMLNDLISTTLNTDAAQFVLLKESLNQHLGLMLSNAGKSDWGAADRSVQIIMDDLQKTLSALKWQYNAELEQLFPRVESFLFSWLDEMDQCLPQSQLSTDSQQQLSGLLRSHIVMTLDSVHKHLLPLETTASTEEEHLSFRHRTSYSSNSSVPFYMEPQELQGCGRQAGNAFLGGPLITSPVSNEPMTCEAVFEAIAEALRKAENQILFDQPMRLCAYQAGASENLFDELNHLKGDRVLIMAALNSHFLTFRRSTDQNWYKLESAAYKQHEQEPIRPGDYLQQRIFHGYESQLDDPSVGTLEIICLEGETLSGILTAPIK